MPVTPIHEHAVENLRYIRETLERAGSFTAVPGWGGVGMGLCALATAWAAARQQDAWSWLAVWLAGGAIAAVLGSLALVHKAWRSGARIASPVVRKFAAGVLPPLIAGAVLTAALWRAGQQALLPGVWLTLYGVAVIGGGAWSVRPVPMMGMGFLALGALALAGMPWPNLLLAIGFGGIHIAGGAVIVRRYGG